MLNFYPAGDIGDYKMPFQDDIGNRPRFEEMQALVSRDRKRPAFPDAWKENNQVRKICASHNQSLGVKGLLV